MLKIIFMGTPDFAVGTLEAIVAAGHEVSLVVTQPDKAQGRSKTLVPTAVKACAMKYDLPVFQPTRIREAEAVEMVRKADPEVIVVVAFGQLRAWRSDLY